MVLFHREPELLDAHDRLVEAAPREDVCQCGDAVEDAGDARVLREVAQAALPVDDAGRGRCGAAEHAQRRHTARLWHRDKGLDPEVKEILDILGRLTMRQRKALLLSGGQQKLVALGRALAIGTKCLLLDEPFEGIAPALSERLSEVLASLKGKDLTLLMSQSDLNHSRGLIDVEFTIERGANPVTAGQ